MHGLINRSIEGFLRDTYGEARWADVAEAAGIGAEGFEPMLDYDDTVTDRLLAAVSTRLDRPEGQLLEDLGTHLIAKPGGTAVRRLLRFSGETFEEFLHGLDDLPSRARLAVPGLDLPDLELREDADGRFRVFVFSTQRGWGFVMLGLLRAMADDYGALATLDMAPGASTVAVIEIQLHESAFSAMRNLSLGGAPSGAPSDAPSGALSGARPGRGVGGAERSTAPQTAGSAFGQAEAPEGRGDPAGQARRLAGARDPNAARRRAGAAR